MSQWTTCSANRQLQNHGHRTAASRRGSSGRHVDRRSVRRQRATETCRCSHPAGDRAGLRKRPVKRPQQLPNLPATTPSRYLGQEPGVQSSAEEHHRCGRRSRLRCRGDHAAGRSRRSVRRRRQRRNRPRSRRPANRKLRLPSRTRKRTPIQSTICLAKRPPMKHRRKTPIRSMTCSEPHPQLTPIPSNRPKNSKSIPFRHPAKPHCRWLPPRGSRRIRCPALRFACGSTTLVITAPRVG